MTVMLPVAVVACSLLAVATSRPLQRVADSLCVESCPPGGSPPEAPSRLVALSPGLVLAMGVAVAGVVAPNPPAFALLVLGIGLLIVVSMVDLAERRIPNLVTYPMIGGCISLAVVGGWTAGLGAATASALIGGATFSSILLGLHWLRPDAMGLGDVKLVFSLGFAIGWVVRDAWAAPAAVGATLVAASVIGLVAAVGHHGGDPGGSLRGRSIPFGPPLSLAAGLTITVALGLS